jgi:hypothetical protein
MMMQHLVEYQMINLQLIIINWQGNSKTQQHNNCNKNDEKKPCVAWHVWPVVRPVLGEGVVVNSSRCQFIAVLQEFFLFRIPVVFFMRVVFVSRDVVVALYVCEKGERCKQVSTIPFLAFSPFFSSWWLLVVSVSTLTKFTSPLYLLAGEKSMIKLLLATPRRAIATLICEMWNATCRTFVSFHTIRKRRLYPRFSSCMTMKMLLNSILNGLNLQIWMWMILVSLLPCSRCTTGRLLRML